jgi:uncharacterized membrane protein YfcA
MSALDIIVAALAGFAAGLINAIAGGGTLVSFPALVALGLPALEANVTNTVALVPGYIGGAMAQRKELLTYASRLKGLVIVAAIGGLGGSVLLVNSSDDLFERLVPFLIIGACLLLAGQERLKAMLARRRDEGSAPTDATPVVVMAMVFPAAIYGGYFGAGLGIVLLAVLGLLLHDPLPHVNSLKSMLSFVINVVAAAFFVTSGKVDWGFAAIMAVTSLLGGAAGGRLARRLSPSVMRATVVVFGLIVAVRFFF